MACSPTPSNGLAGTVFMREAYLIHPKALLAKSAISFN